MGVTWMSSCWKLPQPALPAPSPPALESPASAGEQSSLRGRSRPGTGGTVAALSIQGGCLGWGGHWSLPLFCSRCNPRCQAPQSGGQSKERTGDRKFQSLLHPRPPIGVSWSIQDTALPTPLRAHHRASLSLHTLPEQCSQNRQKMLQMPQNDAQPSLPLQVISCTCHTTNPLQTNTQALPPFALTLHVAGCR